MAWAARKHKLIVCCGDDELIPDEIVVRRSSLDDSGVVDDEDSVVGENNKDTDIEMQSPQQWKGFGHRHQRHQQRRSRGDGSLLKTRFEEDNYHTDDFNTSEFVLMSD